MSVLLIAEHNNKELKPFTLNASTAASQIDSDVHAVIIGNNCDEAVVNLLLVDSISQKCVASSPRSGLWC